MQSPGLRRLRDLQLFRPPNGMWANLGMRLVEVEEGNVVVEAHFSSGSHGAQTLESRSVRHQRMCSPKRSPETTSSNGLRFFLPIILCFGYPRGITATTV